MNKCLCCFLFFALNSSHAQESRTHYTKEDEVTDVEHSYNYNIELRNSGGALDTVISYYTNGDKIRSRESYKNGVRNGISTEYHETGAMRSKGAYSNGKQVGVFSYWYADGKPYMTLQFPTKINTVSKWEEINYRIAHYWDSLGNQIVSDGKGFCDCYFATKNEKERINEKGKVNQGLRDSVWVGIVGNEVVVREIYQNGEFVSGVRFDGGNEIKYEILSSEAGYEGGLEGVARFIGKELKYPKEARRQGIQGVVYTTFIVEKDGSSSNVKVAKSVHPLLDNEAIRILSKMKWEPAMYRGKIVRSRYVFPIKFKLG